MCEDIPGRGRKHFKLGVQEAWVLLWLPAERVPWLGANYFLSLSSLFYKAATIIQDSVSAMTIIRIK
jgi:hypothetical protein